VGRVGVLDLLQISGSVNPFLQVHCFTKAAERTSGRVAKDIGNMAWITLRSIAYQQTIRPAVLAACFSTP